MKSWTFQDTSWRARRGSFVVLTNCHSRFSFSSVVWCFHGGLFWRHRQATSNASAATYWFAFTIATGVIKMGDPSWLKLLKIPTSQPSPFTNGRTTPHPSLTPTPFCAGGVGQSRAWSADNGPTGGRRCRCFSHLIQLLSVSTHFWDVSRPMQGAIAVWLAQAPPAAPRRKHFRQPPKAKAKEGEEGRACRWKGGCLSTGYTIPVLIIGRTFRVRARSDWMALVHSTHKKKCWMAIIRPGG